MEKVTFVKDFQLSRRIQRSLVRSFNEADEEYEKRIKIARYGLEGEDRVNYQLMIARLPLVCLSDIRIDEQWGSAQADFMVISKDKIFIIEVKNLYGSIRITEDGQVIRILPRKTATEEEGMENPFTQVKRQADVFKEWFVNNGFNFEFETIIVMGNPKTAIYHEGNTPQFPMVRYDQLQDYLMERISSDCENNNYSKMIEAGVLLMKSHKERFFNDFESKKKIFFSHNNNEDILPEERLLYEEILECRRRISKRTNIPLCNIFLNREAESLVRQKPSTKEEFVSVPGFKEKKYLLCGEEIMDIIKKYTE